MEVIQGLCNVYNLTSGKSWAEWMESRKKLGEKRLRKDAAYMNRLELLQDADMPVACRSLALTGSGKHLVLAGVYKPQIRVLDLEQLSSKFSRHVDAEVVKVVCLNPGRDGDWQKLVLLRHDRTLDFHVAAGAYYQTRVPRAGRDIAFAPLRAELLVACSDPALHRLNLEQGRFMAPFVTARPVPDDLLQSQGGLALNAVAVNPVHGLTGTAGSDGVVEMWDPRQRTAVGHVDLGDGAADVRDRVEATALQFADDGLQFAAGASNGAVALFDLRSRRPLVVKRHGHGLPIHTVFFHAPAAGAAGSGPAARACIVSADRSLMKVWDRRAAEATTVCNIEPNAPMHAVCSLGPAWGPGCGLFAMACEAPRLQLYFVPELGTAPKWASFLDSLTDELEEKESTRLVRETTVGGDLAHNDYTFVTQADLERLSLTHLIGTQFLRAHMHGFYVDTRLYRKVLAVVEPFRFEEYRKQRAREEVARKTQSRITPRRRLPKVNAQLFLEQQQLEQEQQQQLKQQGPQSKASVSSAGAAAGDGQAAAVAAGYDSRFAQLFTNPDFEITDKDKRRGRNRKQKQLMSIADQDFTADDIDAPLHSRIDHENNGYNDDDDDDDDGDGVGPNAVLSLRMTGSNNNPSTTTLSFEPESNQTLVDKLDDRLSAGDQRLQRTTKKPSKRKKKRK